MPNVNKKLEHLQKAGALPLVSVCIPTYNGADHIKEALNSVLEQTYQNFEIIVSDDGSKDDTLNIVESFDDKRIHIIKNTGCHGIRGNWFNCIKNAGGKYVKVLCQDDLIYKDCLLQEVAAFENNPSVSVVTGASDVIDSEGKIIMKRQVYKQDKLVNGKEFAKKTFANARNYYSEPTFLMFRTQQAAEEKIFSEGFNELISDWESGLILSYVGDVYYISNQVGAFRVDTCSTSVKLSATKKKAIFDSQVELFEKHKKIGVLHLNLFMFIRFKILVRLYMIARGIIYKLNIK